MFEVLDVFKDQAVDAARNDAATGAFGHFAIIGNVDRAHSRQ